MVFYFMIAIQHIKNGNKHIITMPKHVIMPPIVRKEEHGKPASDFNSFRDIFIRMKCIHTAACDGSDSVFLWYKGKFIATADENQNETQTSGVGFRAGNEP